MQSQAMEQDRSPLTTVLFMHGLESGPGGTKARSLREQFTVACPDMHMSLCNPKRCNSPARFVLGYLAGVVACILCFPRFANTVGLFAALGLAPLLRWRLRVALESCVRIQAAELARSQPDVIVGSSWGGAVALRCLEEGHFAGPVVLLAPAVATTGWWRWFFPEFSPRIPAAVASRCVVLHGDQDDTVPIDAVERMCAQNYVRFERVPGGDHRLNASLIASGELAEIVKTMVTNCAGD
eukprot:TRINITY_DN43134_c0_g1_i1.p1 TRINITY_DN43134_c0_g1~~TRINITY_DN43134_c0_g1_i1.p1  ORF type:complete len:239 (+),score=31.41 TRINITY_DN43134_c0_g1_i1:39-755(+)